MNEQTHRWIRTINGFAGRNGYIVKVKGGYDAYWYGADAHCGTYKKAAVAKADLDKVPNE